MKIDEKLLKSLYEEGKMDSEISKILGVSRSAIWSYRKNHNMPTKFSYKKISKINIAEFEPLFKQGLSDYAIANILKVSPDGVYSFRMRHHYIRNYDLRYNKTIEPSNYQKQVLIGTLLGDSSFKISKSTKQKIPALSCAHGIKQEEYCKHKCDIFKSLGATCKYHKRKCPDKRNNKIYEDYTMYVPTNPYFKSWYSYFYKNNKKVIPMKLVYKYFTEISLAFMFMDDGSKINKTYQIATNCFSKDNLIEFQKFLLKKFGLNTTILGRNVLYIKRSSTDLFTKLISPYIIKCMEYKLQSVS